MEGKIYIITNTINNKVYIGQTIGKLSDRFNKHIYDAVNRDGKSNKFHSALINIGIKYFKISLLEIVDIEDIDKKEIEYISRYDSYYNGYNSTLGGGGRCKIEYNKTKIIEDYSNGKTITNIAKELGIVNTKTISGIIKDNNVKIRTNKKVIYSINYIGDVVEHKSISEAYYYILNTTGNYNIKFTNFSYLVNKSCKIYCIAYDCIWTFNLDNISNIIENLKLKNKILRFCSVCNKQINARAKTGMCNSCANVAAKGKSPKPSKEQLLIDSLTMNKQQIANKYGRNKSTICAWFDKYNI